MPTLLILGAGYTGKYAAFAFKRRGYDVYGTTRSEESKAQLEALCIFSQIYVINGQSSPKPADLLRNVTHILATAGPTEDGDPFIAIVEEEIFNQACDIQWIGYLSTIGVYGDTQGERVDEAALPKSKAERCIRRIEAEKRWMAFPGVCVHVFRLPAIYGADRGPITHAKKGYSSTTIDLPDQVFNFAHVQDIVNVLLHSARAKSTTGIYNICDDCPVALKDITSYASFAVGNDPPSVLSKEEAFKDMSDFGKSFYESRNASNDKVKKELGVSFLYPSYREGFRSVINEEKEVWLQQVNSRIACIMVVPEKLVDRLESMCDQLASISKLGPVSRLVGIECNMQKLHEAVFSLSKAGFLKIVCLSDQQIVDSINVAISHLQGQVSSEIDLLVAQCDTETETIEGLSDRICSRLTN